MATSKNPYYRGPVSDHFDGLRFFNPGGAAPKGMRDMLRWQFNGERARWPKRVETILQARPETRVSDLSITMVGHATLLIQRDGLNLLTDPVWSERASPVGFAGPKRVTAPGVAFDDLPPIDAVLLSHSHYDHLDLPSLHRLKAAHDPLVITPLGNDQILAPTGLRCAVLDWGQSFSLGAIEVHCTPCHHWSARGTRDRSMA
jgi:L-ascorbate metabolism protein UlaG (beta-lactamase superfamily)